MTDLSYIQYVYTYVIQWQNVLSLYTFCLFILLVFILSSLYIVSLNHISVSNNVDLHFVALFVESLQSHCIDTMSHCFLLWGTRVQSSGGQLCETGILLLELSRHIGDPDVIDHYGLVWGGLRPKPSLGRHADNVIIPPDLTQLFCPGFTLAAGSPSSFTTT